MLFTNAKKKNKDKTIIPYHLENCVNIIVNNADSEPHRPDLVHFPVLLSYILFKTISLIHLDCWFKSYARAFHCNTVIFKCNSSSRPSTTKNAMFCSLLRIVFLLYACCHLPPPITTNVFIQVQQSTYICSKQPKIVWYPSIERK